MEQTVQMRLVVQCENCQFENHVESNFCSYCGKQLNKVTKPIEPIPNKSGLTGRIHKRSDYHLRSVFFPAGGEVRLSIGEKDGEMLKATLRNELLLGRAGGGEVLKPDLDFTEYHGYQQGISRRHAKIVRSSEGYLYLIDLASSNGTFLNGQRIAALTPVALHDGDEIYLGKLKLHCFFSS